MFVRLLIILPTLLCPPLIWADIYRSVDKEGVVHFTNTPNGGGAELYLREGPGAFPMARPASGTPGWVLDYADRFARIHNLSPALVKAIIKAESNGRMKAVSPKGAQGMMQLMPFTSRRLRVSDPFDPVENIEGGIKYIKELLGAFGGNVVHAVAAYNAGPQAVRKYSGIPPYPETQLYVKRVMTYYRQYSLAK